MGVRGEWEGAFVVNERKVRDTPVRKERGTDESVFVGIRKQEEDNEMQSSIS
jgi:hypothetical protein